MVPMLFVGTWGWLTLRDKQEAHHQEVTEFYHRFLARKGIVFSTDYVLDETLTLLFNRLPFPEAKDSLELLEQAIHQDYLRLEWITPHRFEQAKMLRLKFQDKPTISFTCTV